MSALSTVRGYLHKITSPKPQKRRYAMAAGRSGPLTHSFGGAWGTPDAQLRFDVSTVRARSREMSSSPVLTSFLNAFTNNTLGPNGVHFQMKVKRSRFFGDVEGHGQPDAQVNDIIESRYKEACNKANYLVSRDMTKRLADELKLRTLAIDGEVFIRTWKPFENGPQIARQIIDADLVDIDYNESELAGGGQIRMGIQFDAFGAREGYWLLTRHPGDYQFNRQPIQPIRQFVPASQMRHLFVPLRPGQSRGLPLTAPAILSVRQLEAFVDAATVNARFGAERNKYYTKQLPTGWSSADGIPTHFLDENGNDTGAIVEDLREGETLELPVGVDVKTLDTRFPDGAIDPFTKTVMRFNAMGLGTSYMTLSGDLSEANFSSLRAGLNEERSLWARWQQFFIESDCEPDFYDFLNWGLDSQFIPLPPSKRKKFNAANFTGRRWTSVNPLQDAIADAEKLKSLTTSPQRIIWADGNDPEEILDEIKAFRDMAEARKLNWDEVPLAESAANNGSEPPARSVIERAVADALNERDELAENSSPIEPQPINFTVQMPPNGKRKINLERDEKGRILSATSSDNGQ